MSFKLMKRLFLVIVLILSVFSFALYHKIYIAKPDFSHETVFIIEEGESVRTISERLYATHLVTNAQLLRKYIAWKKLDRAITHGSIRIDHAMTIAELAQTLTNTKTREERTVTIIPGSTLRDIAANFQKEGIATADEVYALLGTPAQFQKPEYVIDSGAFLFKGKPETVSLEGYLAPETFSVFANATLDDVVEKFIREREEQINALKEDIEKTGLSVHEVLTIASVIEKEVRSEEDRKMVADLFFRRLKAGWALQTDSSVHYVVGTPDSVFTSAEDRATDSLWNTYKYPGLPPGPIAIPSISSINAVLHPTPNNYWFFLTTLDTGKVIYSKTVDEHTANVYKYLR
ncbi:MAG TPA: endolytic transglycosylase MltG [Candidatus Magasanikbacteria bacterium]|nr:endolytic transglycosylase MltG [Candidatus Magasanikbacteria bacterium]